MSNILAGIGRGQLTVLDERVKTRRAIFARYRAELSAIPGIEFMPEIGEESSTHWLSVLTIDPAVAAISTFDVMDKLAAENIESRPIWKPMHRQPLFRECAYYSHEENASVSDRLFLHGLCLPSGSSLSEQDQTRIIRTMKDILQK
jgi:pyridoxal phosphate-dependent aminotransferase EpsN